MIRGVPEIILVLLVGRAALGGPNELFESPEPLSTRNHIDRLVFGKLNQMRIEPARLCSDAVFVRRVYLDAIGTLPTASEAREFLTDRSPDKRRALIDRLLERNEFADYWAMKWSDVLRVKAEFPINLWPNAAQAYHQWIRTSIRQNKPYDQFARELLTSSGSNFRVPPVNFYRATQSRDPQAIAQAVALTFMGTRAEKWPVERMNNMSAFFSQLGYKSTLEWKEEIVFFDPRRAVLEGTLTFPDGTSLQLRPDQDPRQAFAEWLTSPRNPWFARSLVNRVWSWLLGRGIVHEPDDLRADNPPANPELLAFLEREFIASRHDLKHLYRLILNSNTYQLSFIARSDDPQALSDFASYPLRRLEAEVLIDALCQITATTESYSSPIPEPFTFIPDDHRAIALPDASITSSFLEMFGRASRDTGLESDRNNRSTADQRLHLLNSTHVQRKLEQSPRVWFILQSKRNLRELLEEVYLTVLSRFPTEQELAIVRDYTSPDAPNRRATVLDLTWALINSAEFLYRH